MCSGMSCEGARSSATGSGTSSRTSVPAGTTMLARSGRPSAVRRPSEMSFWTWLRDRPVTSATYRSIRPMRPSGTRNVRTPAAIGASGIERPRRIARRLRRIVLVEDEPPGQHGVEKQQQDGAADRGVRRIEGVEAQVSDASVDEVEDISEAQAIDHIAERAPEQQAKGDREERVPPRAGVIPDDQAHDP